MKLHIPIGLCISEHSDNPFRFKPITDSRCFSSKLSFFYNSVTLIVTLHFLGSSTPHRYNSSLLFADSAWMSQLSLAVDLYTLTESLVILAALSLLRCYILYAHYLPIYKVIHPTLSFFNGR